GSEADMCGAQAHVRFTPNSDRESGFPQTVMSASPPKADMCTALAHVRFGRKADIESSNLGQQPSPARYKGNPCNSRDNPTRHHFFDQHQCRKDSDPKEI